MQIRIQCFGRHFQLLSVHKPVAHSVAMNATRRIALTFLLMLSIPAQSLALALSECEQHQSRAAAVQHATDQTATEPDCHGAAAALPVDDQHAHESAASSNAGAIICFHCSGACQQSKPLSLNAGTAHAFEMREKAFSPMIEATLSGVAAEVSRPPCLFS